MSGLAEVAAAFGLIVAIGAALGIALFLMALPLVLLLGRMDHRGSK